MLFIGGVAFILYRAGFICFLVSLFSLDFCCVCFLWCLMQNMFKGWQKLCFWWLKTLFWSSGLNSSVFEKHLNSFSCISFMKLIELSCFCIIFCSFSNNSNFQNFDQSNVIFDQSKIPWFLIMTFCLTQLVFDQSKLKNFQFLSIWPKFFFMHHLCLGFTCIALHFFFPHITCINFEIGYSTWFKNWLINFWVLCTF